MQMFYPPFFPGIPLENFKGLPQDQADQLRVDMFYNKSKNVVIILAGRGP